MSLIEAAAERLQGRWCKQALHDIDGNVCLYGALLEVGTGAPLDDIHQALEDLADVIREQFPDRHQAAEGIYPVPGNYGVIYRFNDHKDTTEAEVLAVTEKAALRQAERVE